MLSSGHLSPGREGSGSKVLVVGSAQKVTLVVEGVVVRGVDDQKALGRTDRFEALHFALASSDGLMRVLSAIVGPQALPVDAAETKVSTLGSSVYAIVLLRERR